MVLHLEGGGVDLFLTLIMIISQTIWNGPFLTEKKKKTFFAAYVERKSFDLPQY